MKNTNWLVLTGAPSSGKTSLAKHLERYGFKVHYEVARKLLEENPDARLDQDKFSEDVALDDVKNMASFDINKLIVFDTSWVCHEVYNRFYNRFKHGIYSGAEIYKFKYIFILDELEKHEEDGIRIENKKECLEISKRMEKAYENLGYSVIRIPAMPLDNRAAFIFNHINNSK